VAKLLNMDYGNELQKKLVDKLAAQLPNDEDWDEDDEWQKAYKSCGLKRYKIDKKLMSSVKEIEEHGEVIESSGSKDGKGITKSLFDKEDQSVKLEIKNPEYVDLANHVKTSKSAADAIAALVLQMKKMLPSLQVIPGDTGFFCNYVMCLILSISMICVVVPPVRSRQSFSVQALHHQSGCHP